MITINIYYTGKNGSAKRFAEEMISSGIVAKIKAEDGNLGYDYFYSQADEETVLLIDSWKDQTALDVHHASPMMKEISSLREKYDLHMKVNRFTSIDDNLGDERFIRK